MLTREEQDQIFARAKQFAEDYAKVLYRRRRYQLDPSEADEMIEEAEEGLRDFLKEVG